MQNSKGYLYALATMAIWAGWTIVTRLGTTTGGLTPFDITFLRFTFAGLIMLPIAWQNRHLVTKKTVLPIIIMIIGAGPPYLMVTAIGFAHAPASHGILTPCMMSLFVALLSYFLLKEKIKKSRMIGYALILSGLAFKLAMEPAKISADMFFICGSICWAVYSVQNKVLGFSPIVATSFVATGAMLFLFIPYGIYQFYTPHSVDISSAALQVFYQGLMTSVISLITYNKAIQLIGTTRTSAFAALVPLMVIFLAIPILDEQPTNNDIIFVTIMSAGVLLASGITALPKRKTKAEKQQINGV